MRELPIFLAITFLLISSFSFVSSQDSSIQLASININVTEEFKKGTTGEIVVKTLNLSDDLIEVDYVNLSSDLDYLIVRREAGLYAIRTKIPENYNDSVVNYALQFGEKNKIITQNFSVKVEEISLSEYFTSSFKDGFDSFFNKISAPLVEHPYIVIGSIAILAIIITLFVIIADSLLFREKTNK